MIYFYIKKDSTLPTLRMSLIEDGRHSFRQFYYQIQNADITFSMKNADTGVYKISKAKCYIEKIEDESCEEKFSICYDWKKRDTKDEGTYIGTFDINFGKIKGDDIDFEVGELLMPIREDLMIVIKP